MNESIRSCIDKSLRNCENLLNAENLLNTPINDAAQQIILRMARGTQKQRIDAIGILASVKMGELNEVQGSNENEMSLLFSNFRRSYNQGAAVALNSSINPWMCAFVCAVCAAAILDGVPGDEVVACALCINVCTRGSA